MFLVLNIALEVVLLPAYVLLGLVGIFIKLKPANQGREVVLVHGWFTTGLPYYFFKKYLERNGFSVHTPNTSLMLLDLKQDARKLSQYIKSNNLKNFPLIGVSAGSLVSYYYLQNLGGWDRVSKFISVVGIFNGTPLSYLAYIFPSARQITPGSLFLHELKREKTKNVGKVHCVVAKADELVPPSSGLLEGAKRYEVNAFGHVYTGMFSPDTHSVVKNILFE